MCHHRTTEFVGVYEDVEEREDLPEWKIEDDVAEETEKAEKPLATAETD